LKPNKNNVNKINYIQCAVQIKVLAMYKKESDTSSLKTPKVSNSQYVDFQNCGVR